MKIVIIHYHLYPGGVTSVIRSQIKSLVCLKRDIEICLVCGDCPAPAQYANVDLHIEPSFNYLPAEATEEEALQLSGKYKEILRKYLSKQDICHFHNLNLGKNPALTRAVYLLAKEGYPVLNHCHDFAEDRPVNMQFLQKITGYTDAELLNTVLYPRLPNYWCAALNSFDVQRIREQGISPEQVVLLPNPVGGKRREPLPDKNSSYRETCRVLSLSQDKPFVTYPVRAITRKNTGEFILLAAVFADKAHWVITQPPKNPVELPQYKDWKHFASTHNIPVIFEAGTKTDFTALINASEFCISTSVREGFGMVFLEPWLLGTPVKGRNIPYVTRDIEKSGVRFPLLYDALMVELNGKKYDFKELPVEKQQEYIALVQSGGVERTSLIERNNWMKQLFRKVESGTIEKNIQVILSRYALEKYGAQLYGVYKNLAG